ncbi:MAG: YggT family protein [Pseudomonadota bacterium]
MRGFLFDIYAYLISPIFGLLFLVVLVYVIMSWLFAGGILQTHNPTARNIWNMLHSVIEPMVRPLRRFIPPMGGFDLSLLVFILLIRFVDKALIPRLIMLVPA